MKRYIIWLLLCPVFARAQSNVNYKNKRKKISSVEVGASLYNTHVAEVAFLIGFKDNDEGSAFEVGDVFKCILDKGIGHRPVYHGLRAAIETPLIDVFGAYGTYDIIKGDRWLYDDHFGNSLKVYNKFHGEGTLGLFYAPKRSLIKFYTGLELRHYDPVKVQRDITPHKSASINLKIKYTLDL